MDTEKAIMEYLRADGILMEYLRADGIRITFEAATGCANAFIRGYQAGLYVALTGNETPSVTADFRELGEELKRAYGY
jgi:hypothetical protein